LNIFRVAFWQVAIPGPLAQRSGFWARV